VARKNCAISGADRILARDTAWPKLLKRQADGVLARDRATFYSRFVGGR
jgi:hypothetical protein